MNNKIEFRDLLKIVYEAWEKKAKEFSETCHKKHISYMSKWIQGKNIPNEYDLQKIIDYTFDYLKEEDKDRVRRQIWRVISHSSLSDTYKKSIEKQESFRDYLLEAFNASIGEMQKPQQVPKTKLLMADELLSNITNADLYLKLLSEDNSLNCFLNTSTNALQQFDYLRNSLDRYPLKSEFNSTLIHLEYESEINHEYVRSFYDELSTLQYRYEVFFGWLDKATEDRAHTGEKVILYKKIIKLKLELIRNSAMIILIKGLIALDSLRIPYSFFNGRLGKLLVLEPRQMISVKDMKKQYVKLLSEFKDLNLTSSVLTENFRNLLDQKLDSCRDDINKLFEINPEDKWNEVVGKAISLRQLGRIADAVSTFLKYSKMFGDKDSTAVIYSDIACKFTESIHSLKVNGGVFIFRLNEHGKGAEQGLRVGDIIIRYNYNIINCVPDFINAEKITHPDAPIHLDYLRLTEDNKFLQNKVVIACWPIGIEIMPV